jgi:nucleotide-binding universal stress UspA family protein
MIPMRLSERSPASTSLWMPGKVRSEHADNTASGFGRIDTALARQGLMARQHLTVEADPAQDILRRAEQTGTDLIVLQSGMRKGRILRKIANHAGCSVLAI